jgi:hypothetical protein
MKRLGLMKSGPGYYIQPILLENLEMEEETLLQKNVKLSEPL